MCWPTRVDDYRPPAPRYTSTTRRYSRRYSPSPPPVRRIERTYIRRAPEPLPPSPPPLAALPPPPPGSYYPPSTKAPSAALPPPASSKPLSKAPSAAPEAPPPPPSAPKSKAPSAAPSKPPSQAPPTAKSKAPTAAPSKAPTSAPSKAPSKAPSAAPSAPKSKAPTEAPPPPASNAGSKKSKAAAYVEVTNEDDGSSVSSSSGVRSGSRSDYTHKTSGSRRSSAPPPTAYSVHEREREIRRYMRPVNDFETYRYVEAPALPPTRDFSRHRSVGSRRDSGAPGPRDSFERELKISIKR